MIQVNGLTKYYGNRPAAKDISFKVEAGEVIAGNKWSREIDHDQDDVWALKTDQRSYPDWKCGSPENAFKG